MFLLLHRVKYRKKVPLHTGTEFQVPVTVPVQMWTVPNPTRAAAISSGSRVWAVTRRRLVQSWARVNAIIPSTLLLVLMRINMTEHLMPHVIAQCFNRGKPSAKQHGNKMSRSISFTSASHQCPQLVSSLEKLSLARSISRNIAPYTHYILLNP